MTSYSHFIAHFQRELFPDLEESWGVTTEIERKLVLVLELSQIDRHVPPPIRGGRGRPEKDRRAIARSFVAKVVLQIPSTRALIRTLKMSPSVRKICGWDRRSEIPAEATFSRAFATFAQTGLAERAHEHLVTEHYQDRLVGHLSRDSTAIEAREKALRKTTRCRQPKGHRIRRQMQEMSLQEMKADLPTTCDWGCKTSSRGHMFFWGGYKLHVDWADGEIPVSCLLTSASTHDSQVAIPLATMSAQRVVNLYDLMDSAYDSNFIRDFSHQLGHVPLIDRNRRAGGPRGDQLNPAHRIRLAERSTSERGVSRLKDSFGARWILVRGATKVMAHLMFAVLALTADQLLRLTT